jgi:hypothetical protein
VFDVWKKHAFDLLPPEEEVDMRLIAPYLDHLLNVICHGDGALFQILLDKDAWMFQNPNSHVQFATVLMGTEGAGKNIYTNMTCDLWGDAWVQRNIDTLDKILGDGNRKLIGFKKLIVPNELQSLELTKTNWDALKSKISDDTYTLRSLYEDHTTMRNVNNYIFCTNNFDSIRMGLQDRRYFVLEVSDEHVGDIEGYFAPLCDTFTDEMKKHLLNFYLRRNVTRFNSRFPPTTALKEEIKESNKGMAEQFMDQFEWSKTDAKNGLELGTIWNAFSNWVDANGHDRRFMGKGGSGFGLKIRAHVKQEMRKVKGKCVRLYFPKSAKDQVTRTEMDEAGSDGEEDEIQ